MTLSSAVIRILSGVARVTTCRRMAPLGLKGEYLSRMQMHFLRKIILY